MLNNRFGTALGVLLWALVVAYVVMTLVQSA